MLFSPIMLNWHFTSILPIGGVKKSFMKSILKLTLSHCEKAIGTTQISHSRNNDTTEGQPIARNKNALDCREWLSSPSPSLKVGDRTTIERVINKEELNIYKKLTNDYNPIHTEWDGKRPPVVHGALLVGLVSAALGTGLPGAGTFLAEQILKFPKPCYVGEKIVVQVEIVSARKIIECKFECRVGSKKVVLQGTAKMVKSSLVTGEMKL